MEDGQNTGVTIQNNFINQNQTTDTIKVNVYDVYGKKLIEGVTPVNLVHGLTQTSITYRDP
jgi:hypothetical protein